MSISMSYERRMLNEYKMPEREKVENALILSLFNHQGVIQDFSYGEEIVNEIANYFDLNWEQRNTYLETIYRKENRVKKSLLWHRLLFRAADSLAKQKLVSRPSQTIKLTKKREWMITEKGFDLALEFLNIPVSKKDILPIKSIELQRIVKNLKESPRPENYNPFDEKKRYSKIVKKAALRSRGFRIAVLEAYDYKCAVCRLKICSPDSLSWEVQAAHIVPHNMNGKDDIWNGLALCHLHHWAFDVGWFTLMDDYKIRISSQINLITIKSEDFIKVLRESELLLPIELDAYPHQNTISWHRHNVFCP